MCCSYFQSKIRFDKIKTREGLHAFSSFYFYSIFTNSRKFASGFLRPNKSGF